MTDFLFIMYLQTFVILTYLYLLSAMFLTLAAYVFFENIDASKRWSPKEMQQYSAVSNCVASKVNVQ